MSDNLSALFLQNPEAANILRRRALAERLMQPQTQTPMTTPMALYGNIAQQLAGALMSRQVDSDAEALGNRQRAETKEFLAPLQGLFGGQQPSAAPQAAPAAAPAPGGVRTGAAIPVPDNLDDADILTRTLIGEAGNQGEEGQRAVAHVVRNRMQQTGRGVRDVVLAANQFEPWGARREELLAIQPTDPRYIAARRVAEATLAGQSQDPTSGATHFLNPDLQRQLGRQQPAWAPEGQGQRIGAHVFYRPGGGIPAGGPGVIPASAPGPAPAAPAAAPQPGAPNPGIQNMVPRVNLQQMAMAAALSNNPGIQRLAPMLGQLASREPPRPVALSPGQSLVNPQTGQPIYTAPRDDSQEPLVEIRLPGNQGTIHVPRSRAAYMQSAPQAQQPSERERAQERYIRLSLEGRTRQLTAAEQAQLELDGQTLAGDPQVVVGNAGVGYVPPRPLPLGGGTPRPVQGPGAPSTIPIQQPPAAPSPAPAGPQAVPVREDAIPGVAAPSQRGPQQVQIPGRGTAQFIPADQPPAQPPQQMASGMLENVNALRQARSALDAAIRRPESFGLWQGAANMAPGVLERLDPEGVAARAAVGNLSSLVIHDRSGAAVTAAEFPRLRPFIPQVGDPPEVVRTKLERFVAEYEAVLRDQYSAYGPAAGYRPLDPVEEMLRAGRVAGPNGQGLAEPPPSGGGSGTRRPISAFQR